MGTRRWILWQGFEFSGLIFKVIATSVELG